MRVVQAAKHLTGPVLDQIRHAEGAVSVAPCMYGGQSRKEDASSALQDAKHDARKALQADDDDRFG